KIANVKSLLPIEEKLDYVVGWDENTNRVLVVAGNWGYQIAKNMVFMKVSIIDLSEALNIWPFMMMGKFICNASKLLKFIE
ncbi:MAG: hypothetical protein ACK452_06085, partial [Bacteroidota bacterium]